MSSRRRRGESDDDLLGKISLNETSKDAQTLTTFANSGYGSQVGDDVFPELARNRVKVQQLELETIFPDFAQPRRVIPSQIRQYWSGQGDQDSIKYLFDMWGKEVVIERGHKSFNLNAYLTGDITERAPEKIDEMQGTSSTFSAGPLETALLRIAFLAASIRRDGLTNPITVVQRGPSYVIETGERRWLAFQLLRMHYPEEKTWQRIPARVMERASIWRQASENNVRSDLNAIAKARQLALIIMDLYMEQGVKFRPFEIFKNEQAFYAQVADPVKFKIPYGKGELVLNAMGFENKSTIKRYRDLLTLPSEVWTRADDYNVPESVLRQLINKPNDQMLGFINMWLETGRLSTEEKGAVWHKDGPQYGKFSRLLEYDMDQWLGEYENLDENSRQLVIGFLKELLAKLGHA